MAFSVKVRGGFQVVVNQSFLERRRGRKIPREELESSPPFGDVRRINDGASAGLENAMYLPQHANGFDGVLDHGNHRNGVKDGIGKRQSFLFDIVNENFDFASLREKQLHLARADWR